MASGCLANGCHLESRAYQERFRPIADLHYGFLMLQCSPSLQTFVQLAAFIWLKLRCAGQSDQSCKSVGWPLFVTPRTERLGFGRILYNYWLVRIGHTHKSYDLDKKRR